MAYLAETDALLLRFSGSPTTDQEIAYDNLFYRLKNSAEGDLLAKTHALRLYNSYHENDSLLNIIENDFNASNNGASWTQYEGYTTDGINDYIDPDYNPSTDSAKVDVSDLSIGVYLGASVPSAGAPNGIFGVAGSGSNTFLAMRRRNTQIDYCGITVLLTVIDAFDANTLHTIRYNAGVVSWCENGIQTASSTQTQGTSPNQAYIEGAINNNGTNQDFGDAIIQAGYICEYLTLGQLTEFKSAIDSFFSEIDAVGNIQLSDTGNLTGSSSGSTTASGAISANGSLIGGATASCNVSGSLKANASLVGSTSGTSTGSGLISSSSPLIGACAASSSATGQTKALGGLKGLSTASSSSTAELTSSNSSNIAGVSNGLSTTNSTLTALASISGNSGGSSSATVSMVVEKLFIGQGRSLMKWVSGPGNKNRLGAPSGVTITAIDGNQLLVSFNSVDLADAYQIHISEDDTFQGDPGVPENPEEEEIKVTITATTYLIDNLLPGEKRFVRVISLGKNYLDSVPSEIVSGTTIINSIWLEAECGSIGDNWDIVVDGGASNGKHITPSPGSDSKDNAPSGLEDRCSYEFEVQNPGNYKVWLRIKVTDQAHDSIWVRMDGGSWIQFNNISLGTDWHWDSVHDSGNLQEQVFFLLGEGSHTLDIAFRDDIIQIDRIYLTQDGDIPVDVGDPGTNCFVPADPSDLLLTAISTNQIDISWKDNAINENGYTLEWSPNGVDTWTQLQDSKATSFSHSGLIENTTYHYRIRGYNTEGNSNYLTGNQTTLVNTQLQKPVLSVLPISLLQLQASWGAIAGADDYRIEFDDDGSFLIPGFASPTLAVYVLGNLANGTTKFFRVQARGAGKVNSPWSDTVSGTTPGGSMKLATPTNLQAVGISISEIDLDFDAVPDAVQYEIKIDTDPSFPSPTTTTTSNLTLLFSNLLENTTYYISVTAQNAGGGFTDSDPAIINATTKSSTVVTGIYYESPVGLNTDVGSNSRNNPAPPRFFCDGPGYASLQPGDRVYWRTDQGAYDLVGGLRLYGTGAPGNPIVYQAEPGGGFAHFRIQRFPQSNWKHLDRYINPNIISIGGEWRWKNPNDTSDPLQGWNKVPPEESTLGRFCYIVGVAIEGQYKPKVGNEKVRDFSLRTDLPYGNTGARAAGTITGEVDGPYDYFTGNIGLNAVGAKIISCLSYHNGQAGSLGASSAIVSVDKETHLNIVIGTGHSGPDGRDHGHNRYLQHRSDANAFFIVDGDTLIGSCEEQIQLWSQGGVVNTGQPDEYSKVDKFRIIDCIAAHGGGLNGAAYPNRNARNILVGGYSWDMDIRLIGFLSYKNAGETGAGVHFGYSLNGNNERRNLHMENCHIVCDGSQFYIYNVESIQKISGNVFVARTGFPNFYHFREDLETGFKNSLVNVSNNRYYFPSNVANQITLVKYTWNGSSFVPVLPSETFSVDGFKVAYPGSEVGSFLIPSRPTNFEKVKNNNYLSLSPPIIKKKTIFNDEMKLSNSVKISSDDGLAVGDKVRIVDCQNIAPNGVDKFIKEHTFVGPEDTIEFDIPDENSGVAEDPTGEMQNYNHSTIEWCHIAVIRVR